MAYEIELDFRPCLHKDVVCLGVGSSSFVIIKE